jgi:hypothetical protein
VDAWWTPLGAEGWGTDPKAACDEALHGGGIVWKMRVNCTDHYRVFYEGEEPAADIFLELKIPCSAGEGTGFFRMPDCCRGGFGPDGPYVVLTAAPGKCPAEVMAPTTPNEGWQAEHLYEEGHKIMTAWCTEDPYVAGIVQLCMTGGISGVVPPVWPTTPWVTTEDNGVVWVSRSAECLGVQELVRHLVYETDGGYTYRKCNTASETVPALTCVSPYAPGYALEQYDCLD